MHEISDIKIRLEPEKLWNFYTLSLNIFLKYFSTLTISYLLLEHVVSSGASLSLPLPIILSEYVSKNNVW
jgi:hypothetical protein